MAEYRKPIRRSANLVDRRPVLSERRESARMRSRAGLASGLHENVSRILARRSPPRGASPRMRRSAPRQPTTQAKITPLNLILPGNRQLNPIEKRQRANYLSMVARERAAKDAFLRRYPDYGQPIRPSQRPR